ncbi:hypothetical protein HU200_019285 [Digitaria exilis]|uniref:Pentatricopeptide repeat-containing protein n=1 Tax=Digitaria exilis TaxID=1010633 RepID=A0A835KGP5_9POAL|nr:hypothetical protein HU200_019285 [Digitaria exilis]
MLRQLVRSGKLAEARSLFDAMPHRDEVAYATLLAGHAEAGDFPGAMELFCRLRASSPPHAAADPFVLSPVFKACASAAAAADDVDAGFLRHAAALHAFAVRSSAVSSVFVSTALVDAYAKAGRLELALEVFDEMPCKNVVSWTTLVASLARAGRRHDALRRFAEMRTSGVACDSHAYAAALTACAEAGLLPRGREVHALCAKLGLDSTPYVANTLATLYARCGDVDCALAAVSRMGSRDVAAWTTLIASYVQTGRAEEAIEAFIRMIHDESSNSASPNKYTFSAVIAACANTERAYLGEQLHAQAARRGLSHSLSVANSLVKLYVRCGRLSASDAVFRESFVKDVVSWSTIISGYAQEGLTEETFALFSEMRHHSSCPRPNEFTLASLLSMCASAAALDAGRQLHALVVAAGLEHHAMVRSALVDMYGKSARGEEETGKKAAERVMEAEPWGSGAHVAMANLYASKGQWLESAQERHLMKQRGVVKGAGWSSVEVGGEDRGIGVFVSGDRTNPQDNAIYVMLDLMYCGAGMVRHIPDQLDLGSELELAVN